MGKKEEILKLEKCDVKIVSFLRKSNLQGHPLAKELMKTQSDIVTELEGGINLITSRVMGSNERLSEMDPETGDEVWKDVKTLRDLLQDVEFPQKERNENSHEANLYVAANENYIKARVYYKAFFGNDVVTYHPEKFRGKRYWKFPIKYLFQYNDEPNVILSYEDIELKFYTDIRVCIQNKDLEWIKDDACSSVDPSGSLSSVPSCVPTLRPSLQPSDLPSEFPSLEASVVPSIDLRSAPSVDPSGAPSSFQSLGPSLQPSCVPSSIPSLELSHSTTTASSVSKSAATGSGRASMQNKNWEWIKDDSGKWKKQKLLRS